MASLPESARALIASARLGHLTTVNADGSAQVVCRWVGLDGDELVTAHLNTEQHKLKNVRRDPRVVLSFEADGELKPPPPGRCRPPPSARNLVRHNDD
jgi:nitroimidazol reductase NimA-like FMN-containing flavoprotein (pyridoxamine 5'-phosphate oxidase superfamily)